MEATEPPDAAQRTATLESPERRDGDRLLPSSKVRRLFGIGATTLQEWDAAGILKADQRGMLDDSLHGHKMMLLLGNAAGASAEKAAGLDPAYRAGDGKVHKQRIPAITYPGGVGHELP